MNQSVAAVTGTVRSVSQYADRALRLCADRWNGTPLLCDVLHLGDETPYVANARVTTNLQEDRGRIVSSNLIFQMQFLRLLVLLTRMTGDEHYEERAKAIIRYHFDNLSQRSGRMIWGTHHDMDLLTLTDNGYIHELKCDYPFYDLLFEVNPEKAANAIRASWRGHVYNWNAMDLNRHAAEYDRFGHETGSTRGLSEIFKQPFTDPRPFTPVSGLTFLNIASDLIYGALKLYERNGDRDALAWAERLYGMYLKHRHPKTGVDSYTYGLLVSDDTYPRRMEDVTDRGYATLWPVYGPLAYEGHIIDDNYDDIFGGHGQIMLAYRDRAGEVGQRMFAEFAKGVSAYVRVMWDPALGRFRRKFSDGTDYTGDRFPKGCYFGSNEKKPMMPRLSTVETFLRTAAVIGDDEVWACGRQVLRGRGLGDVGELGGRHARLNLETADAEELDALLLLRLFRQNGNEQFLRAAEVVIGNAENRQRVGGLYQAYDAPAFYELNALTPYIHLMIEAERQSCGSLIPETFIMKRLTSISR